MKKSVQSLNPIVGLESPFNVQEGELPLQALFVMFKAFNSTERTPNLGVIPEAQLVLVRLQWETRRKETLQKQVVKGKKRNGKDNITEHAFEGSSVEV
eukprot:1142563-Pelagomonas_calceolata.AAC.6